MYEAFYGLKEKPFSILPDPDLIYWGRMHSMAFTMLEFGVMNNAGFTVITGEIGSGKTTLVRHLLKMLNPNITTGLISNSPQGRQELLQWILMALGQPFDENDVVKYIDFRLQSVGAKTRLFSPEACAEIAWASGGIPRMINILCDTALVYGFASGNKTISSALVQEVIADKQQFSIFPLR